MPSALAPVKPIKFILPNVQPAVPVPAPVTAAPNAPAPVPAAPVPAAPADVASPGNKGPYYSLGANNEGIYANVPGAAVPGAAVPARSLMENANYAQGSAPAAEFAEAKKTSSPEYQEVGPQETNCKDPKVMPWLVYLKDFDVDITDEQDINHNKKNYEESYTKMKGYQKDTSCNDLIKSEVGDFFNKIKKIPENKKWDIKKYSRYKEIQKFINDKNKYYEKCKTQIINEIKIKIDDIKTLNFEQIKLLKTNYNDVPEMKDYVDNKRKQFTELSKIKNIYVDYTIKRFFESFPEFNIGDEVKYVKTEYHGQWSNKDQSYDSETTYEYTGKITKVDTKYKNEKYENTYTIITTTLKENDKEVQNYKGEKFTSTNSSEADKIILIKGASTGGSRKKKRITKRNKKYATKKRNTRYKK